MPYRCTVSHDLIRLTCEVEATVEETLEIIKTVTSSPRCSPTTPLLVDLRDMVGRPKLADVRKTLKAAWDSGAFRQRKIAIVIEPGDYHGVAAMAAAGARVLGMQMRLFTEQRDAREWLGNGDDG